MPAPVGGRVLVFGSINTDLVVYVPRLPAPGETLSGGRFASFPGGKGANQAVAASRAGASVTLYGCVGDDEVGRQRLESLAAAGVSTEGIRVVAGTPSGIASITVDDRGENTIVVAPGANSSFEARSFTFAAVTQAASRSTQQDRPERIVSLFQNEVPQEATEELIVRVKAAGHLVIWNLAPTVARMPEPATLRCVDILVCNRNELAAVTGGWSTGRAVTAGGAGVAGTGARGIDKAVGGPAAAEATTLSEANLERRALGLLASIGGQAAEARAPRADRGRRPAPPRGVIVTLGSDGLMWAGLPEAAASGQPAVSRLAAFRVEAVDTVGAGDCFCGVLAASLSVGLDVAASLRRASAAAAISTTRRGAQPSMPSAAEVDRFLAERGGPARTRVAKKGAR